MLPHQSPLRGGTRALPSSGCLVEKGGTLPDAGRWEKQVNRIIKEAVARRRGF